MLRFSTFLSQKLPKTSVPLALLGICVLAFGPLTPFLGFSGDEWQLLYEGVFRGWTGLVEYLYLDGHPLVAWLYWLSFNLLGANPLAWQVYSLLLRWLAAVTFWLVLGQIWPKQRLETFMASALFILHPVFTLQSQAVAHFEVWISYSLLWLSFLLNIHAIQKPQNFLKFTALAILLKSGQLFTSEYAWGTEFLRLAFVWIILTEIEKTSLLKMIWRVLKASAPYLVITAGMLLWRVGFYSSPTGFRAEPVFLEQLGKNPAAALSETGSRIFPDITYILWSSWGNLVAPEIFNPARLFNLFALGIGLVGALATWIYLQKTDSDIDTDGLWLPLLLTGVFGTLAGMIPFIVSGNFIHLGPDPFRGRFSMGALPGAGLTTVALATFFIRDHPRKILFFAILTGLMLNGQIQGGDLFRKSWASQQDFYRQLTWRIPGMQSGTALVARENILPIARGMLFAVNAVYGQPIREDGQLAYGAFLISDTGRQAFLDSVSVGIPLVDGRHEAHFEGASRSLLVIQFKPVEGQCLWLITPEMTPATSEPLFYQPLSQLNAYKRIETDSIIQAKMFNIIFGSDINSKLTWCYYFEKADLARQFEKWEEISRLWEEAKALGLKPGHGVEYLPFIEGYTRQDDRESAITLTKSAIRTSEDMPKVLCPFIDRLGRDLHPSNNKAGNIAALKNAANCP